VITRDRSRPRIGGRGLVIVAAVSALITASTPRALEARGPLDASLIVWTEFGPDGLIARAIHEGCDVPRRDARRAGGADAGTRYTGSA
jgi:hypothetical protein